MNANLIINIRERKLCYEIKLYVQNKFFEKNGGYTNVDNSVNNILMYLSDTVTNRIENK